MTAKRRPAKRVKAAASKSAAEQRRALFVEEYLANSGNATQAAIKAGYSKKTAKQQGSRLLTNVDVAAEVAKRRETVVADIQQKTGITKEWVTERLRVVAERCLQTEPVLNRKGLPVMVETPDGGMAVAFEFNSMGANRALELIGKELGMFVERKEVGEPGDFERLGDDELLAAGAEADKVIAAARSKASADQQNKNRGSAKKGGVKT